MGGAQTISTSETKAEALVLQSSAYGVTKAVVHGSARVPGNLVYYADFRAIPHVTRDNGGGGGKGGGVQTENTAYTYSASLVMLVCEGVTAGPSAITRVWRGKAVVSGLDALAQIGASLIPGGDSQAVWSPLTTIGGGAFAQNYSGMMGVAAQDYNLGSSAQVENHSFEVRCAGVFDLGGTYTWDADPSLVAQDWLTNKRWGIGLDAGQVADLSAYSAYCRGADLLLSPALTEQAAASERLKALGELTNSRVVLVDQQVHIVPLGDEEQSGNGVTYYPDTTPIYDLTLDHFLTDPGQPAVRIKRKTPADAYNSVKVEYLDRANDYNVAVATAQDQASIEQYGLKVAPTITAHWVCDGTTADAVAQIALKRFRYILNSYTFALPWNFARLVPTNIVTLQDADEGLVRTPVRITTITEDDGGFTIDAEDFPHAVAGRSTYALQGLEGFRHDYNAAPGAVVTPVFIEPPIELTTTGLEVWVAVTGNGPNWGGCQVWISADGTNYKQAGNIYGGARYGITMANLTASASSGLEVLLTGIGGQILNGSAAEAANLSTLCWVRGTGSGDKPELIAYTTATLTSTDAYTLDGLVRSAYESGNTAHATGSQFARLDKGIYKSDPLQPSAVGQTVHFKFQSFNLLGKALEDLAGCTEYVYTVRGDMLSLPCEAVSGLTATQQPGGVLLSWHAPSNMGIHAYTVLKLGTGAWSAATEIWSGNASSWTWPWPDAGSYTIQAKHVDIFGAESAAVEVLAVTVDGSVQLQTQHLTAGVATDIHVQSTSGMVTVTAMSGVGGFTGITELCRLSVTTDSSIGSTVDVLITMNADEYLEAWSGGSGSYSNLALRDADTGYSYGAWGSSGIANGSVYRAPTARTIRCTIPTGVTKTFIFGAKKWYFDDIYHISNIQMRAEVIKR